MTVRSPRALVLGGGPVACAAAIVLARRYDVTLRMDGETTTLRAPRVDAVPLQTLGLLVEFGAHPQRLGVSESHATMLSAWETPAPQAVRSFPKVHLDRRRLDAGMRDLALRHRRIVAAETADRETFDHVVDASGRRALTAAHVHRAVPKWIARVRSFEGRFTPAQAAFRIAALPTGYVYRLGTEDLLTLGFVGPSDCLSAAPDEAQEVIRRAGAGWILAGLADAEALSGGRGGACSTQWAQSNGTRLVGDAAFAPDILSAQGLSLGLADAARLGDPTPQGEDPPARLAAHRASLQRAVARCGEGGSPAWRHYADGLLATVEAVTSVI